ncbi:MAG: ParA family protein [Magnetococcus sp. YQC-5]
MYTLAIYNNKGGVGKSTLTVFMADFLASLAIRGRTLRVVVLDLDPQGSCATAVLGGEMVTQAKEGGYTLGRLARDLDQNRAISVPEFLFQRHRTTPRGRATPISEVHVMLTDKPSSFAYEVNPLHSLTTLRDRLKPVLATRFDVALLDLPGNIDERNLLAVNGLIMSDSVTSPVEVSRFSINALPATVEMVDYARMRAGGQRPTFLGMILNRTDKRGQQYQQNIEWIRKMAAHLEVPVFDNVLPNAQSLAVATEEQLATDSLKERYGTYYPHVKAVVLEMFQRWGARSSA